MHSGESGDANVRIAHVPSLRSGALLRPAASPGIDALDRDRCVLTATASGAIYLAVRALGLTADDVVLCPAYNCGHEVEAVLRGGARVAFYSIDRDLEFSLDDIASRVDDNVRAVLVTHFFGAGVPLADLAAFCDARSLVLIEDCAHLLPQGPGGPGSIGDVAVYSLRKLLPLPDGGLLRLNDAAIPLPAPAAAPTLPASLLELSDSLYAPADASVSTRAAQVLLRRGLKVPLRLARRLRPDRDWDYAGSDGLDYPTKYLDLAMSAPARRALGNLDWPQVCADRRRNFRHLLDRFPSRDGVRPLLTSVRREDCPLVFPVLCRDPVGFLRAMHARGVPAAAWWPTPLHAAVPWDEFESARDLKRLVCALPIHQDLGEGDMQRILTAVAAV